MLYQVKTWHSYDAPDFVAVDSFETRAEAIVAASAWCDRDRRYATVTAFDPDGADDDVLVDEFEFGCDEAAP